jgi:hypothetical protein
VEYSERIESWRPYPGWEGWYEVSDKGQIRSVDRFVVSRIGHRRRFPGQVLTGRGRGSRYHRVRLCRGGEVTEKFAHVMVLETFAGPCPAGQEARHGPRGPLANWWPEDLCWGTHADNQTIDRERDGTTVRGEQVNTAKLNEAKVRQIRVRAAAGELQAPLALEYGVSQRAISCVVLRQTWAHVA